MRRLYFGVAVAIFTVVFGSKAVGQSVDSYDPIRFGLPEAIGGYPVLAVLTEENTACMKPGEKHLVLQSPQPAIEDGPRDFPKELIEQRLQKFNLAEEATQWELEIVGPGVTREQLVIQYEQSYRFFKAHNCPTFKLSLTTSSALASPASTGCPLISVGEGRCESPSPGFAIIQNLGPGTYPNNNGQSVILIAPSLGNNNTWKWKCGEVCTGIVCRPKWCGGYSAFLNNGMTDKRYFLQVGLSFTNRDDPVNPLLKGNKPKLPRDSNGIFTSDCVNLPETDPGNPFSPEGLGYVVFAGAEEGGDLSAYALCVPYVSGHHYYTTIAYTSGTWWTCAADIELPTTYRCIEHRRATEIGSTHLITDRSGTNVFAENWNKHATWTQGFPYQWVAYEARIYVDGIGYPWPNEAKWTQHSCTDKLWPPNEAIVNSSGLANNGQAFFNTAYLPAYCE